MSDWRCFLRFKISIEQSVLGAHGSSTFFFLPQSALDWLELLSLLQVLYLFSQECKTKTNNRVEELLGLFTNLDLHEGVEMLTVIL